MKGAAAQRRNGAGVRKAQWRNGAEAQGRKGIIENGK